MANIVLHNRVLLRGVISVTCLLLWLNPLSHSMRDLTIGCRYHLGFNPRAGTL